jgi:tetratricopeptide repeat protein
MPSPFTKKLSFSLLILAFLPCIVFCSEPDTTIQIKFSELHFSSNFERNAFAPLEQNNKVDLMELALATDENINDSSFARIKGTLNTTFEKIRSNKKFHKKPQKKVQFIFDELHDAFLTLYSDQAGFSDIFNNGDFNCLTASVLFALAFDYFSIPYEIKISNNHSYIVAYPKSFSVILETTNPLKGIGKHFDYRSKSEFVDLLLKQKRISQEEAKANSIEYLFNNYYYRETGINLKQAVGALYANQVTFALNNKAIVDAYHLAEKSYFLYPRKDVALITCISSIAIINKREYSSPVFFEALNELFKFTYFDIKPKAIAEEYYLCLSEILGQKKELLADSIYHTCVMQISDSIIRIEVSHFYNYERGRLAYNENNIEEAEEFFQACLKIKPITNDLEQVIGNCFIKKIQSTQQSIDALNISQNYANKYPGFSETNIFKEFRLLIYLYNMYDNFDNNQPKAGEDFREKFMKAFDEYSGTKYMGNEIARTYSQAAMYYFRRNQIKNSRRILEEGLRMVPNNFELSSKLKALY